MSVVLVCPSCHVPATLMRPPVATHCLRCGTEYPAEARAVAQTSLEADQTPRPFGVTLGAGFCALWGGAALLVALTSVIGSGPFRINDVEVTKTEFLTSPVFLGLQAVGPYALVIAYFVFVARPSVRPLMLAIWVGGVGAYLVLPLQDLTSRLGGVGTSVTALGIAWWYLYRKPNVRAYFERLDRAGSVPAGG